METSHPPSTLKPLHTLADIRARYNVRHVKDLPSGLAAIRYAGLWYYFRFNVTKAEYELTGATHKLERQYA